MTGLVKYGSMSKTSLKSEMENQSESKDLIEEPKIMAKSLFDTKLLSVSNETKIVKKGLFSKCVVASDNVA